jgi:chemotaxis protein methyltransferase CheR
MMLSNQQFDRTRMLALSLAGIELVERHRELLARRSRRLGIGDSAGLDSLLSAAEAGVVSATQKLLSLLTTKFTGFFRHPRHFEIAAAHTLQVTQQRGQSRLWSAAAATGEEPWSLAMAVLEAFEHHDPPVRILATDVDVEALAVGRRGEYGEAALRSVSTARRAQFFIEDRIAREGSVISAARRLVDFRALNLTDVEWPVEGTFDVIFVRNVLMYFRADHRYAVLERMASLLAKDGVLLLDPAEHLGKAGHWFTPGADGVYSLRRGSRHSDRQSATPMRMYS